MNCRGINGVTPPILRGNPPFFVIMGLIILVQVLIVQAGGTLFDTVPLSPPQWMIIIIGTMPVLFLWPLLRFFAGGKEGRKDQYLPPEPERMVRDDACFIRFFLSDINH